MNRPPPDIEPIDTASAMFSGLSELHEHQLRRARRSAAAWGFVLGFTAAWFFALGLAARAEPVSGPIYVIDGDTVRLAPQAGRSPVGNHAGGETVRVFNIDAPETRPCSGSAKRDSTRSCARCEAEAALGYKAKERLARLLSGARIAIHRCDGARCQDQYGRTLARLKANGRDVGETLIAEGLATRWPERFNGCGFRRSP